jgi:hypothetical protein
MSESLLDRRLPLWVVVPLAGLLVYGGFELVSKAPVVRSQLNGAATVSIDVCSPRDISVSAVSMARDYDFATVDGYLMNNCGHSIRNALLQFSVTNKSGTLEYSQDFYAAPTLARIGRGSAYKFELITRLGDAVDLSYRVDVIRVID